eukprot:10808510-Heterocapsa_arctica.AAC.1
MKAVDEVTVLSVKLPLVFQKAVHMAKLKACRTSKDTSELLKLLVDPANSDHNTAAMERELLEAYLTDHLRSLVLAESRQPPQKHVVKENREALVTFCKQMSEAKLEEALQREATDLLVLLNHDQNSTEAIREADGRASAQGAGGLYKIFAALCRNIMLDVRGSLAESSQDHMLENKLQEVQDIMVGLRRTNIKEHAGELRESAPKAIDI